MDKIRFNIVSSSYMTRCMYFKYFSWSIHQLLRFLLLRGIQRVDVSSVSQESFVKGHLAFGEVLRNQTLEWRSTESFEDVLSG